MMEVYDILFQPAGGQGIEHGTARLALQLTKLKDDDHNAKNKGFEKRFNSASYPTIPRCLTHLSNRTSSPQSLAQADEWFQNCLHNHEHCQRILPSTNFLPTGIPVKELSKVFRDTMLISKRMGFELIWIDSLCECSLHHLALFLTVLNLHSVGISQDSVLDWKSESTVMNSIYNHGVLNIASTGFHDGSAGLFVERSPEAFNQLQMVIDNECPSNGQAGKSNSSLRSGNYHLVDILA